MKALLIILRVPLAFVFIYAAVAKAQAQPGAARTLYDQWLAPGSVGHYAFILLEFALALWILSGLALRASAGVAVVVLVVFTIFIGRELSKYAPKPCGCLGDGRVRLLTPDDVRASLRMSLARNLALVGVAGWLALMASPLRPSRRAMRGQDLTGSPPIQRQP
jgi:uncharacterized membrane protein YphA (DoxX/SURF4 family)